MIYVEIPAHHSIAMIYVYQKNDQENLTEADKKAIRLLIEEINNVLPLKVKKGRSK